MLEFQRTVVALVGVVTTALICWYFWPANRDPSARLTAGAASISYDAQVRRLTVTVNVQNSGDRETAASIINAVWINSKKGELNDPRPQPWRTELAPKQISPVVFIIQGETAADVWSGVELMEVTIYVVYDANAKLNCSFSFVGRFYPLLKQIGTVSSVTSPTQCRFR